jgi:hypothetical protein
MGNAIQGTHYLPVRLGTQFDKTNTTLATITGFSFDGLAGRTYKIKAKMRWTAHGTGGIKFAINGSATFTDIRCSITFFADSSLAPVKQDQLVTKGTAVSHAGTTAGFVLVHGAVVVDAAGTVTLDMAEFSATGTASILTGAIFEYKLCQ